jgi:hypothetical protein
MPRITYRLAIFALFAIAPWDVFAQSLKITSPMPGTVVNPGQTVKVTVSVSGGKFASVGLTVPGYMNGKDILHSPPVEFSFRIPPSSEIRPGLDTIVAVALGGTASEMVSSAVPIDIERPDYPQKITTDTTQLDLRVGDHVPILVFGTYSDGSIFESEQIHAYKVHHC